MYHLSDWRRELIREQVALPEGATDADLINAYMASLNADFTWLRINNSVDIDGVDRTPPHY